MVVHDRGDSDSNVRPPHATITPVIFPMENVLTAIRPSDGAWRKCGVQGLSQNGALQAHRTGLQNLSCEILSLSKIQGNTFHRGGATKKPNALEGTNRQGRLAPKRRNAITKVALARYVEANLLTSRSPSLNVTQVIVASIRIARYKSPPIKGEKRQQLPTFP